MWFKTYEGCVTKAGIRWGLQATGTQLWIRFSQKWRGLERCIGILSRDECLRAWAKEGIWSVLTGLPSVQSFGQPLIIFFDLTTTTLSCLKPLLQSTATSVPYVVQVVLRRRWFTGNSVGMWGAMVQITPSKVDYPSTCLHVLPGLQYEKAKSLKLTMIRLYILIFLDCCCPWKKNMVRGLWKFR